MVALKLFNYVPELRFARMNSLVLKLVSRKRVRAEEAIDFQFWAVIFDVLDDSFDGFNFLVAWKTLYIIAFAFVFQMLFDVLHENTLLDLIVEAAVLDFDFTNHVLEEFVLNFLEDWLWNEISRAFLRFSCPRFIAFVLIMEFSILYFDGLAVRTSPLSNFKSIAVCQFELTPKADKFVTIVTFLRLQRDLFANHAGRLADELLLEFVDRNVRISWHKYLNLIRWKFATC